MEHQERQPVPQQMELLHDLEHYIRTYGLDYVHDGQSSELNTADQLERVTNERDYQDSVHKSIFGKEEESVDLERVEFLRTLEGRRCCIHTSTETITEIPLMPLATACDAVYALVSSPHFANQNSLTLKEYEAGPVREFLDIVLDKKQTEDISDEHIIDCCRMAHFWQAMTICSRIVEILEQSIDSHNCLSLCELADQLQFPSLFERSLSHVFITMEVKEHAFWDDLNIGLQQKILNVQTAIRSSIHSRGHRSKLFFSSFQEYLAILEERVRYQRERLQEAKERQIGGSGPGHDYAAEMIARQEQRTRTLELFFIEQEKIFGNGRGSRIAV